MPDRTSLDPITIPTRRYSNGMVDAAPSNRWGILMVLMLPVLIISMDATMLGFAVPHLSEALEPSSAQLLWIIDVYSFVLAGLLVTMGVLGDRIGRRRLLLFGAAGFSSVSLLAAFAPSAGALIAARALLGLAGATLMPSTLSLVRNVFIDDRERQVAIATWAATFAVGGAIGPIVGGVLLDHFWWGSVFLVGVPTTAVLLVAAPRMIPESRDPDPGRFDLASSALTMCTTVPIVYAVKTTAERGPDGVAAISLALGLLAGTLFVRRQRRLETPMIDLSLFRVPGFRNAIVANLIACFGLAGGLYFITQYFQLVEGLTALRSGIQLLPAVVAAIAVMAAAPALLRRFRPFSLIAVSLGSAALGFALFLTADVGGSLSMSTLAITISYAGLSLAATVGVDGIMSVIPPERAGAGASVSETANELGIALGTAILGSVLTAVYRPRIDTVTGLTPTDIAAARETLGAAMLVADDLPATLAHDLITTAREAFVTGMHVASLVAAVLLAAGAVLAATTRNPRPPTGTHAAPSTSEEVELRGTPVEP